MVTYHDDINELQGASPLRAALAAMAPHSLFDRIEWWSGLARHCGIAPLLALASQGDQHLVLPLSRSDKGPCGLANWYTFRLASVSTPGADRPALLTAIAQDLARRHSRVSLSPLADEDGERTLLEQAFRAAGWIVQSRQCDVNHVLKINGRDFESYLASRPGQLRTTLRRKGSRLDIQIHRAFNPDLWAQYEQVYAQSWKPAEGSPAFLKEIALGESRSGHLRLGLAYADGEPVAAQFWTAEAGTAYIHKLANTEASKPLSPGTVLTAALIRHVIEQDHVTLIDFGTGDDSYKRDWMEEIRPRFSTTFFRPLAASNWPEMVKGCLRGIMATD